ncbi:hypothetical protein FB45DRAFT_393862 [Roridomyces roridus]|uniref:Protein kinase domain-containing protein n=1 Tax=Roridomyces roridus TaxID=1738132 RepID=A0AAD7B257_9AGAR|nr:hypothetical protein FB45DRAFT_393862 [Roridomyces roridus]
MPGGESNIVFNNHISGGTGGRGGQAGRIGGRGGDGQAPHVRQSYKLVAENVTIDNRSTHTPELGGTCGCLKYLTLENVAADFEQIRRGDIDLRREIRLYVGPAIPSSVIARRMFSAQIRQQSEKSVILYEGEDAEEECRQYILKYANLWHPNIMQIFGVSNFGGKHAVIAQDSLIPHTEYLALHRHSVILRIFLLALWNPRTSGTTSPTRSP